MRRMTIGGREVQPPKPPQTGRTAAFVFGDYDSGLELYHLLEATREDFRKRKVAVNCYLDAPGKLAQFLERHNVYHYFLDPLDIHHPDIIIVGTSQYHRACPDAWTQFGRGRGTPVVWVNGSHGVAAAASRGGKIAPSLVFAVDEVDAEFTRKILPGTHVVACGKPSHHRWERRLAEHADAPELVRQALGVPEGVRLVSYWAGSNMVRTASHLRALIGPWLTTQPVRLALRFPHIQGAERQDLIRLVERGCRGVREHVLPAFGAAQGVVAEELLLASDATITD